MLSRSSLLGAAAGVLSAVTAAPAGAADACRVGPPEHPQGPSVFLNYDQVEIDAAYDQSVYAPLAAQIQTRIHANAQLARKRLGEPLRVAYGPTEVEKLDIYRAHRSPAPIFVFIHGGAWINGDAFNAGAFAELFVAHGAVFVAPDFILVNKAGGDLGVMADQVRRAVAWVWKNAATFGGDRQRLYVGGHSSGGHLSGVVHVTDWIRYGLPVSPLKGGMCMSGMYELAPVALSKRSTYVNFTPTTLEALSSQRHLDMIHAPLVVSYGTFETPEFQRQNREFAAALQAAGKPVQLIVGTGYNHYEMQESLGNPYGPNGRAALALMGLAEGRSAAGAFQTPDHAL